MKAKDNMPIYQNPEMPIDELEQKVEEFKEAHRALMGKVMDLN